MKRFLATHEYDALLLAGLCRMGADEATIRTLLAARWPLFDQSIIVEAQGRGLSITFDDVQSFLDAFVDKLDVEPFDARQTCFHPDMFDRMLQWLVEHGRGKSTLTGSLMEQQPQELRVMLENSTARAGVN